MFFIVDISHDQPNQTQTVESEETIILSHKCVPQIQFFKFQQR